MSSKIKIATWNINSVRFRIDLVLRFLREQSPDILCLQEIKVPNNQFPEGPFRQLGYNHQVVHGQPMHHGVATISRIPIREAGRQDWQDNGEARHVGVEIAGGAGKGVRLENVYVPAGGELPDRVLNPKFGQKLDYIERMTRWAEKLDAPTIITGDFNIAPLESDVWSHKQLINVVSHTAIEIERLDAFKAAHDWVDLGRQFVPAPGRLFTWWSYRARDWATSDRGRRLDHVWASPDLAGKATGHRVVEEIRGWVKPSDHAPLITEFDF